VLRLRFRYGYSLPMQAMVFISMWKYSYLFSRMDVWLIKLCTISLATCFTWASVAPQQYARWRHAAMGLLHVLCYITLRRPHRDVTLISLAAADPWRQGVGVLSTLHFLVLFTFATGSAPAALWAYAAPLPLPLHLVVQATAVASVATAIPPICAAAVMGQAPSVSTVHKLCYFLDVLAWPFPWGQGLRASEWLSPDGECWAVMVALLVLFAYIIPTAVLVFWEYHEFSDFWRQASGRFTPCWCTCVYQSLPGGVGYIGWAGYLELFMAGWLLFTIVWDTLVMAATDGSAAASSIVPPSV
jgi:hypothetical protein